MWGDQNLENLKTTPLYHQHEKLRAKLINFSGWKMPLSYEGVLPEHHAVRKDVGVFDVSHMGEIRVRGKNAEAFLQHLLVNNVANIKTMQSQYTAMVNENGGVIDDLIVMKFTSEDFLLCVNANNIANDYKWIESHKSKFTDLHLENESEEWAQIAIQGPKSLEATQSLLTEKDASTLADTAFTYFFTANLHGVECIIARTGYTGEKGYEIYMPASVAEKVWVDLLEKNGALNIRPIGLGARDTLRLESGLLLHGNDMSEEITPLECGIAWVVKFDHDFVGKDFLEKQKTEGPKRRLRCFKMVDNGIPRHEMYMTQDGKNVGTVTSGSVLPTVGGAGGFALMSLDLYDDTKDVFVNIRGKDKKAELVKRPMYKS